jgi:hypothetical protein
MDAHQESHRPIAPLRPNYAAADFQVGQSVLLRCDGSTGVPQYLHGSRAAVVKGTSGHRRLCVRLHADGVDRELRVTPNQIAIILE